MESCDGIMTGIFPCPTGIMENRVKFTGILLESHGNPPSSSTKLPTNPLAFSRLWLWSVLHRRRGGGHGQSDSPGRSASVARGGGGSRPAATPGTLAELAQQAEQAEQAERSALPARCPSSHRRLDKRRVSLLSPRLSKVAGSWILILIRVSPSRADPPPSWTSPLINSLARGHTGMT